MRFNQVSVKKLDEDSFRITLLHTHRLGRHRLAPMSKEDAVRRLKVFGLPECDIPGVLEWAESEET